LTHVLEGTVFILKKSDLLVFPIALVACVLWWGFPGSILNTDFTHTVLYTVILGICAFGCKGAGEDKHTVRALTFIVALSLFTFWFSFYTIIYLAFGLAPLSSLWLWFFINLADYLTAATALVVAVRFGFMQRLHFQGLLVRKRLIGIAVAFPALALGNTLLAAFVLSQTSRGLMTDAFVNTLSLTSGLLTSCLIFVFTASVIRGILPPAPIDPADQVDREPLGPEE
jgi:hypothetical protein